MLDLRLDDEPRSRRDQVIPKRFRLGEGWSNAEPHGRWALGERSALSVYVSDPEDLALFIECRGIDVQLMAGVLVNGVVVGQVRPTSEWNAHALELDAGVLRPGLNLIEFAFQLPPNPPPQLRLGDPATIVREMIGDVTPSTAHLRDLLPVIREVFPRSVDPWRRRAEPSGVSPPRTSLRAPMTRVSAVGGSGAPWAQALSRPSFGPSLLSNVRSRSRQPWSRLGSGSTVEP